MREVWSERDEIPAEIAVYIDNCVDMMEQGADYTRPYQPRQISRNIKLFSAPTVNDGKSLIVCFCGGLNRLMLPIPVFLQFMPETACDVLLIKDPSGWGYLCGVPEYAADLSKVADRIAVDLDVGRYANVKCLGVSGGGSAALYAGLLLDAERAISICGKHRSLKLAMAEDPNAAAFSGDEFDELVRGKLPSTNTRLILAFGARSAKDVVGARSLKQRLPSAEIVGVEPIDNHNLLYLLLKRAELRAFFERFLFAPGQVS
jgi:hypothetical protein